MITYLVFSFCPLLFHGHVVTEQDDRYREKIGPVSLSMVMQSGVANTVTGSLLI